MRNNSFWPTNLIGPEKSRRALMGIVSLVGLVVLAVLMAGAAYAEPPTEEDYFGTVVSAVDNLLVITVEGTTREIPTTVDTKVRLPLKRDADLSDLFPGDRVAVSLEDVDGVLVAEKVFVIPGKTQFRHLPGEVKAVSDTEITIQPPAKGAEPITFARTATIPQK